MNFSLLNAMVISQDGQPDLVKVCNSGFCEKSP